jgi:hypothetical protein
MSFVQLVKAFAMALFQLTSNVPTAPMAVTASTTAPLWS